MPQQSERWHRIQIQVDVYSHITCLIGMKRYSTTSERMERLSDILLFAKE